MPANDAVWIGQRQLDELRAFSTNIHAYGGIEISRYGAGPFAGINLVQPMSFQPSSGSSTVAAASISSGSGLIYDVALINPLTGEALESSSAKAMPLQLNYFYAIPSGTKVVVVPLDVDALGDGSGV